MLSFGVADDDASATVAASWAYLAIVDLVQADATLRMRKHGIGLPDAWWHCRHDGDGDDDNDDTGECVTFANVNCMFYDVRDMYHAAAMTGHEEAGSDQAERRMQVHVAIDNMIQSIGTDEVTSAFACL